ncbi:MAG: hypothetical protein MUQ56_11735 [Thermoleophilia bacterium]|jgi:hypothetical protein|nr:hypothetical protein [Thermoleophilia bacterium]
MLKVSEQWLHDVEQRYPGIRGTIDYYEALNLPPCPGCGSVDTAAVSAGLVGRSIHVGASTTKMRLLPNGIPEDYYCNACERYFGGPDPGDGADRDEGSLLLDPRTATDDDLEAFVRAIHAQAEKDARVQRRSKAEGADGPKTAK